MDTMSEDFTHNLNFNIFKSLLLLQRKEVEKYKRPINDGKELILYFNLTTVCKYR